MFGEKNLLDVVASSQSKYVTALMEILFTGEEMKRGLIFEGKSISKRSKLDATRVNLLKGALYH